MSALDRFGRWYVRTALRFAGWWLSALPVFVIVPGDGSGYEWEQRCTVTPTAMRCIWFSGPDGES